MLRARSKSGVKSTQSERGDFFSSSHFSIHRLFALRSWFILLRWSAPEGTHPLPAVKFFEFEPPGTLRCLTFFSALCSDVVLLHLVFFHISCYILIIVTTIGLFIYFQQHQFRQSGFFLFWRIGESHSTTIGNGRSAIHSLLHFFIIIKI